MKYPSIGDTFYWKDFEGNIHEDICRNIDNKDSEYLELMYFTDYNIFVTESCIIDSNSKEVKEYLKNKVNKETDKYWTEERKKKMIDFMWYNISGRDVNRKVITDMFESLINDNF